MSTQVRVTSIDALERFRASLIIFLAKARRSMDEVADEVRRTRVWLQSDQRTHWENQLRRRRKVLEQAEAELFSAKLSGLRETTAAQQNAVLKARRSVAEGEEKLRAVKNWNGRYDACAEPLTKSLEGLRFFLDFDLPKGVMLLALAQKTLEAYADSPAALSPQAPPADAPSDAPLPLSTSPHPARSRRPRSRPMNTRACAANLVQAMKELSVEWDQTKAHWRDVEAREFEEHYLEDLPGQVTKALSVIEEIDTLLSKIRSDCE